MIYDTWANLGLYRGLSPALDKMIDFALANDIGALPPGRTDIDGDNVYVMIQTPELKPEAQSAWECHDQYADVQLGLQSGETIGYLPREKVRDWSEYQPDARLSRDPGAGIALPIDEGCFALFLPADAHKPGMGKGMSKKAVFKVRWG